MFGNKLEINQLGCIHYFHTSNFLKCERPFFTKKTVLIIQTTSIIFIMQKRSKPLRVATLNFSGINVSPFQYHDGSKEKQAINRCFKKLLDDYQKEHPSSKWNIAKIDKILQRDRYTILYRQTAGVVRGRLLDKNQFQAVWDAIFEQNQHLVAHLSPTQESINLLRAFDWMMYQAFITTLYGKINWNNMREHNIQRFVDQLKKWHQKKYLKWQPKINFVRNFIIRENLDILFLQQAGHQKLEASIPDNYVPFRAGEAMIIIKKSFIVEDPQVSKFHLAYGSRLNFNHDSHYVKLKHYLLCCAHLSSKSGNVKQAQQMSDLFREIRNEYENLNIIAGVDANHHLKDFPYFNIYPSMQESVTTRKMRTSMQLQFEKSQKLVEEAKDHLISNLVLEDMKVQTIHCEQVTNDMLPNQDHPYDHFIVYANLKLNRKEDEDENGSEEDEVEELPFIRSRHGSFATTTYPDQNSSKSDRSHGPSYAPSIKSDRNRKHQNQILNTSELLDNQLRLSGTCYLHPEKYTGISISTPSSKVQNKSGNVSLKIEGFCGAKQVRPSERCQNKYYNQQKEVKPEIEFLQFSKSAKGGLFKTRSKSKTKTKEGVVGEELRGSFSFTPKIDKSKQLGSSKYKKY